MLARRWLLQLRRGRRVGPAFTRVVIRTLGFGRLVLPGVGALLAGLLVALVWQRAGFALLGVVQINGGLFGRSR